MTTFRRLYGAGPLHLVMMALCLGLGLWVVLVLGLPALWNETVWWQSIAVWFIGAALIHDLVLLPIYAALDRTLVRTARRSSAGPRSTRMINAIRIPTLGAGLTFLIFFPGIISQGSDDYLAATGLTQDPYLERWLLLVLALYLTAAAYIGFTALLGRSRS